MSKSKPTQVSLIEAARQAGLTPMSESKACKYAHELVRKELEKNIGAFITKPNNNDYSEYQKYLKKIREAEAEYHRQQSNICINDPGQVKPIPITTVPFIPKIKLDLTQAVKADDGKRDWDLLPMDAVEEIVKVLEFGAKKYSADNWRTGNGFSWKRVLNSSRRHLYAFIKGEDNDPETGLSHMAHLGCNVLFLLHFILNKDKYNQDDRTKS